jgi:hypothetical protein
MAAIEAGVKELVAIKGGFRESELSWAQLLTITPWNASLHADRRD